ncbi:Ubiquitin carboxyl-terminal hydrolase 5 [Phytophthora cinnamomi]|uniref:Ubiquitin carboxyl-terminal hydrolase 5 n=1 Tax=Phytophthora cinnamomi TaxID=4785 RepID=UPI00355A75A4|nr:Ubiquitin carboxyl-terminal hydrolase 5 [Phytophthora cinnamomi]
MDLRDLLSPIDGGHDDSEPCTDRCFVDALDPRVRLGIEYLQNELNIPLSSASRSCTKYDLYAVVNHCGRGISSGHYTAHIRRPDESRWWLADDTVVTPLREDELSPSATAYLLFYVRQDIASGATELSDLFPTESD